MATILLIDDDDLFRETLKETLERAGYQIVDVPDGKVATEIYREGIFDLILTDIFMPEQDGIGTIDELVRKYPDIKIIAISGGGSVLQNKDYLKHAELFGAARTFQKPVDTKQLIAAIKELLGE